MKDNESRHKMKNDTRANCRLNTDEYFIKKIRSARETCRFVRGRKRECCSKLVRPARNLSYRTESNTELRRTFLRKRNAIPDGAKFVIRRYCKERKLLYITVLAKKYHKFLGKFEEKPRNLQILSRILVLCCKYSKTRVLNVINKGKILLICATSLRRSPYFKSKHANWIVSIKSILTGGKDRDLCAFGNISDLPGPYFRIKSYFFEDSSLAKLKRLKGLGILKDFRRETKNILPNNAISFGFDGSRRIDNINQFEGQILNGFRSIGAELNQREISVSKQSQICKSTNTRTFRRLQSKEKSAKSACKFEEKSKFVINTLNKVSTDVLQQRKSLKSSGRIKSSTILTKKVTKSSKVCDEASNSGKQTNLIVKNKRCSVQYSKSLGTFYFKSFAKYWIIMASVVWWCYDTANCVQMEQERAVCPMDCDCYSDLKEIYCDGRVLRMVPSDIPPTAVKLSLSNNNIRELSRNIFRNSGSLKELILKDNAITNIPVSSFYGLKNLEILDLSGNQLIRIPTQAFHYLKNIREIRIRNNPIEQLLAWDFIQVRKTLLLLDLGKLTRLNFVSKGAFSGLENLQILFMDSCGLARIPSLQPMINIQQIDLSSNKFGIIPETSFLKLNKLRSLDLSDCRLKEVRDTAFDDLESLQEIQLSSNNLTSLVEGTFLSNDLLSHIQLENNPWICNCDLLWLAGWLWDNPFACADRNCPKCQHPLMYRNMPVANLTQIEDPPCAAFLISDAQTSLNVSAGEGTKIPCPTIAPTADSLDREIRWSLPNGTTIQNQQFEIRTIQRGGYEVQVKTRIRVLDTGTLNFSKVTLEDSGTYICSVATNTGEYANSTVYLNVTEGDGRLSYSFFTTETTIYKNPDVEDIKPKQSRTKRPPTQPSVKYPRTTATTSKYFRRTTTQKPSRSSRGTVWPLPSLTEPPDGIFIPPSPQSTTPESSVQQVMETTKIIIGCFIGITLIAAALLVIFYKMRKKNPRVRHERPRRESQNDINHTGYATPIGSQNIEISTAQKNLIGRIGDENQPFIGEHSSDMNTGQNTASVMSFDTNQGTQSLAVEGFWRDSQQPLLMKECKDNEVNEVIMTPQILPPPPEEMFFDGKIETFVTTPSLINMTSQESNMTSLQSSMTSHSKQQSLSNDTPEKMGPLEQGYDSLKFMKQMMPPPMKPINGGSRFITHQTQSVPRLSNSLSLSQRDLLNDLASSCQKVALSRNSKAYNEHNHIQEHCSTLKNNGNDLEMNHRNSIPPKYERFPSRPGRGNHTIDPASWRSCTLDGSESFPHLIPPPGGMSRRFGSTQGVARESTLRKLHNSSMSLSQTRSKPQQRVMSSRLSNIRPNSASFVTQGSMDSNLSPTKNYKGNHASLNYKSHSRTLDSFNRECKMMSQRKIPIKIGSIDGILTHKETEI